jgi:hypothetical protein
MRMTRGWTGLRTAAVALTLAAVFASAAQAAPVDGGASSFVEYSTSGTVGLTGVTGPNVISYNSVAAGSFTSPSSFSLGEFLVAPLMEGSTTTYNNTPFAITYLVNKVNGTEPDPNETPITITGVLNGTIVGATQSDVVATIDPIEDASFLTGDFINEIAVLGGSVSLVPSTTNGGRTTAQAHITVRAAPVPEPTSIAVFLTALAGFGLHRRRARARA